MSDDYTIDSLIRLACVSIENGDPDTFLSSLRELERQGWDKSAYPITEALFVAVEHLPDVDADAAADLAHRTSRRFEQSLHIVIPTFEAVLRSAAGDVDVITGIPRDRALTHSLVAIGQIIHDGYATFDDILEAMEEAVDSDHSYPANIPHDPHQE